MQNKQKDPILEFYSEYNWFVNKPKIKPATTRRRRWFLVKILTSKD